jgi:hypothetical protein
MKHSNDIIGNRTRDPPTCRAVPNPTKNSECLVKIMEVSESLSNGVKQSSFEKLTVPQLVKKFPALYGTRRFVAVFTTAYHSSQCWTKPSQSTPSPTVSLRSIYAVSFLPVLIDTLCACLSNVCHVPYSSYPSWFDYHNDVQSNSVMTSWKAMNILCRHKRVLF